MCLHPKLCADQHDKVTRCNDNVNTCNNLQATSPTTHRRNVFYTAAVAACVRALMLLSRKEAAERKAFPVAARNANDGLTIRYASVVGTQAVTREH